MGPPGYQLYKSFHTSWSDEFVLVSMVDLQDPIHGGTLVPYVLAIFSGDIHLHRPYNYSLIYGRYLHFRILKFPLIVFYGFLISVCQVMHWSYGFSDGFQILTHLHLFGCCLRFPVLLCWSFPWNCQSHEQWISGSLLTSGRSAILTNVYFGNMDNLG